MVKAECFTKQEKFKYFEFPNSFVAVPSIGDRVQAIGGKSSDYLNVVKITHAQYDISREPYIIVELDYSSNVIFRHVC